ncbi:MAG TPA: beta-propeller domain-containing protein, partial [Verrucomicrobiota bacterium]|nr:beta-propeller domain-containing protein [Verrucomicrobiota bacterium]
LRTFRRRPDGGHEALGRREVGHGESLFGTRFDGDRAYIVTFLRVDPLWIIDLGDPANPRVAGELEIPGWSNHLHPLGDRLLTVGIDDVNGWRAAVQLFDVGDPARPALLAKVPLGETWSWSEANSDEKALAVMAEEGLVLLPFQGDRDQGVQILDLGRDTLTARGVIRGREVVPRRSALHRDRVLTVSARELLAVNVADRDRPQLEARLELAYPVERVVLAGGFLLEFSGPELRVRHAQAGSPVLDHVPLAEAPVLGAWRQGGHLHVLQGISQGVEWIPGEGLAPWVTREIPGRLIHRVYDLAALPALRLAGEGVTGTTGQFWGDFRALEPLPGLIVWTGGGGMNHFSPWFGGRPGLGFTDALWGGPWMGGWGGPVWHLAVDVSG